MSNDDLQVIVDSYKRVQMERSQADALKHMEGRWGRVCHAVQRVVKKLWKRIKIREDDGM